MNVFGKFVHSIWIIRPKLWNTLKGLRYLLQLQFFFHTPVIPVLIVLWTESWDRIKPSIPDNLHSEGAYSQTDVSARISAGLSYLLVASGPRAKLACGIVTANTWRKVTTAGNKQLFLWPPKGVSKSDSWCKAEPQATQTARIRM